MRFVASAPRAHRPRTGFARSFSRNLTRRSDSLRCPLFLRPPESSGFPYSPPLAPCHHSGLHRTGATGRERCRDWTSRRHADMPDRGNGPPPHASHRVRRDCARVLELEPGRCRRLPTNQATGEVTTRIFSDSRFVTWRRLSVAGPSGDQCCKRRRGRSLLVRTGPSLRLSERVGSQRMHLLCGQSSALGACSWYRARGRPAVPAHVSRACSDPDDEIGCETGVGRPGVSVRIRHHRGLVDSFRHRGARMVS